jgi:hypothetical protein
LLFLITIASLLMILAFLSEARTKTRPDFRHHLVGYALPRSIFGFNFSFLAAFAISSTVGDLVANLMLTRRPSLLLSELSKYSGQITSLLSPFDTKMDMMNIIIRKSNNNCSQIMEISQLKWNNSAIFKHCYNNFENWNN